ncbi:MAG: prolyl oligopeptidase family serine peptidase [bacterium]
MPTARRSPFILRLAAVLLLGGLPALAGDPPEAAAQEKQAFTPRDALRLESLSVRDITPDGRWLVCTAGRRIDRMGRDNTRYGDPTYDPPSPVRVFLLDGESGEEIPIFPERVTARGFTWSPDGGQLAFFLQEEGGEWGLRVWERERARLRRVPIRGGGPIASRSTLQWYPDRSALLIEQRGEDWEEHASLFFDSITEAPVVVHDSSEDFLHWDAMRNLGSLTVPTRVDLGSGAVEALLPEGSYRRLDLSEDGRWFIWEHAAPIETVYARRGGTEYEVKAMDLRSGPEPTVTVLRKREKTRPDLTWDDDGTRYAWEEEGEVFLSVPDAGGEGPLDLTSGGRPYGEESDTSRVRFSPARFSPDGTQLLLTGGDAWWLVPSDGGEVRKVRDLPDDEDEDAPRTRLMDWSPDGRWLYLSWSSRTRWERGIVRYDLRRQEMEELVKETGLFRSVRLTEDGETFYFEYSDGDHPEDLYRAPADLSRRTRLTRMNPWIADRTLTRSELVSWLDVDGEELYGILYYPVGYEEGERYPLVCEIYETFFDNGFNTNMNMFANAGYFGFRPSVDLEVGYPGEAWVKGVTTGVNMLIERGLVDPGKMGVQGGSYGGYATALLITQTPRFAAAINISGKVNMVSFYPDSPRLGIRNIQAPEWGQDRIGGSLWEYPERYLDHSAIMSADRIETPLMLITGDLDPNVPARQSMEMYYAMRRLGKEVVWVRYTQGAHSPPNTPEQYLDYWDRILGWYEQHFADPEEGGPDR